MRHICIILLSLLLLGCDTNQTIHFYSLDKSQCITVIDQGRFRYIIDGKHLEVPKSNYVKLDVQDIDPLGDGVWVCWENEKHEWDVVVDDSKIVESKLDTTKFNFETNLPRDERGIPTEYKFRSGNCAVFGFHMMRLSPNQGAIVEIL